MNKSFQSYLMFWYSVLVGCALVVFSVLVHYIINQYIDKEINTSLISLANTEIGAALELDNYPSDEDLEEPPHIHKDAIGATFIPYEGVSYDRFVNIFNTKGKKIDSYSNNKKAVMPWDKDIIMSLKKNEAFFKTINLPEKPFRMIYLPILEKGKVTYVIQVGTYISRALDMKKKLKLTLLTLSVIIIALSLLSSYILSQKAVSPLRKICAAAQMITAENLDKRLNIPSPLEEVNQLTTILNNMLNRIHLSFNAQKQFIANASHEMRSPLTAVKGTIEVTLRKRRGEDEYRSVLHSSIEEINRLSHILKDLLTLAIMDYKKASRSFNHFNLVHLLKELLQSKKAIIEKKNIRIETNTNGQVIVYGDVDLLYQVLSNLLDNAIKYTQREGTITIVTYLKEGYVYTEINDTGIGISSEDLPKVFERFFRADKSRSRDTGGTGLGLSIVKEIITLHNGDIFAKSKIGEGSTFTFTLPVVT